MRAKQKIAIALLGLAAWLVPAAQAPAADPKPVWHLLTVALPTNLSPGDPNAEVLLVARNIGGAPTTSPITLTDTLPEGITPTGAFAGSNEEPVPSEVSCEKASAQTISCTSPGPIGSDRQIAVRIDIEVDAGASGTLLNEAAIGGGGATEVKTTTPIQIDSAPSPFDFLAPPTGFAAPIVEADGSAATAAGSHPDRLTVNFDFPSEKVPGGLIESAGHLRDLTVDLPPGQLINPAATPVLCTEAQLTDKAECPPASQVGTATVITVAAALADAYVTPLFNMVPPPGEVASLAFDPLGVGLYIHAIGEVRSDGDFGLSGTVSDIFARPQNPAFGGVVDLWGDPASPLHDKVRGKCIYGGGSCPVAEPTGTTLLGMPSDCPGTPTVTKARAKSWEEPDVSHEASYESADLAGNPVSLSGCNQLAFNPTIESKPTTNLAESPSGLDFHLHQPQDMSVEGLSTAPVKDISIALPEGMTLNPSAADGIEGCSSAQIGLKTAIGETPIRIGKDPQVCPDASRLGTLEVRTPALAQRDSEQKLELDPETGKPIPDPLFGSVYLAKPYDNPFNSLLAIYLVLEDEQTGIVAKVPAKITADPNTGQLVTTVKENPQLPLEDVRVHLFGGARAPLITPTICGNHTTTSTLTPWSSPEGLDSHPSDSFATTASPAGGECATSPGAAPNNPAFNAGTIDPVAGAYSPFVLKLSREDASQRFTGVNATLPPGLIGKLAGVSKCSEAQIADAKAREAPNRGQEELASPSCPASSEVGVVDVSAGAGPTPLFVKARAYMAGPYKGAPLSLLVITPAVAGPFDLGTVAIRVALDLDSKTAQISAASDPIPTLLEGIPLDVRSAAVRLDRPNFTLNPTSCDPMAIEGTVSTIPGGIASLRSPFQVGGCAGLGFKPKLDLRLKGGTKRGGHPAFQATYRPRPGDANAKGLVVRLPRSAFLDQAHIRTICTRVQFAAGACPKGSQYGYVKAWTPLLEEPLEGPVYLRSSDNKLPDLVFDLHGIVDVEVATRIDSVRGGIRASIESAPDAPLTKVVLNMQGAKKGLIVNSRNLCKGKNRADVQLSGQNGKAHDFKPELKAKCGKKRKKN